MTTHYKIFYNVKNVKKSCAICYKSINKTYFKCNTPCSKIFHINCIHQLFDTKLELKCCYCQRILNFMSYILECQKHFLMTLHHNGLNVKNSLRMITIFLKNDLLPVVFDYMIYDIIYTFQYKYQLHLFKQCTYKSYKHKFYRTKIELKMLIFSKVTKNECCKKKNHYYS